MHYPTFELLKTGVVTHHVIPNNIMSNSYFLVSFDGIETRVKHSDLSFGDNVKSIEVTKDNEYWIWSNKEKGFKKMKVVDVNCDENKLHLNILPSTRVITTAVSNELILELNDNFATKFQEYGKIFYPFYLSFTLTIQLF